MSETATLNRVILSFPSLLHLAATPDTNGARRSWVQLAKTGEFVSTRYGKFSITRDDLSTMLHNFKTITPKSPTELPVDFDHLSMDPKKPGDGIAAGWMKRLELRSEGDELWAEIEWTPDGATRIENKEYRFVSPSFVKNHTHKDGKKIGTTLLAAAITNHPFLEGMSALTLADDPVFGGLALAAPSTQESAMTVGQKVTFIEDEEATPELSPQERAQVFVVTAVGGGAGDDAFVKLKVAGSEKPYGWYPMKVLAPARAPQPARTTQQEEEDDTMQDIDTKAAAFAARVTALSKHASVRDAINLATTQDAEGAACYWASGVGATVIAEAEPVPVLSLSARSGETFDNMCLRYATEHGVSLRQAVHEVGRARPDLASAR